MCARVCVCARMCVCAHVFGKEEEGGEGRERETGGSTWVREALY